MYKLMSGTLVLRLSDNACIPLDEANTDCQQYLAWLKEDNAPEPADVPTDSAVFIEKIKTIDSKIADRLNSRARLLEFDSISSAGLSAALPLGEYRQADGASLLLWSARTWQKAAEIRDAFLTGLRPEPTWDEIEAELPDYPIE